MVVSELLGWEFLGRDCIKRTSAQTILDKQYYRLLRMGRVLDKVAVFFLILMTHRYDA